MVIKRLHPQKKCYFYQIKMRVLYFSILIAFCSTFFGQNQEIDSLENLLSQENEVAEKVNLMDALTDLYGNTTEAELYVKSALGLTKSKISVARSVALNNAFDYYTSVQDFSLSILN